jgi:DNA-binding CsgD family transcriptional regulator
MRNSNQLTPRETEVVKLICDEYSTMEIAEKLNISHRTVEAHRWNIFAKLRAKSSIGVYKFAVKSGIVELEV